MAARWTALVAALGMVLLGIITYETHGLREVARPTMEWRKQVDDGLKEATVERREIREHMDLVATQAAEAQGRTSAIEGLLREIMRLREAKPDGR